MKLIKHINKSFAARFSFFVLLIVGVFFIVTSVFYFQKSYQSIDKQTKEKSMKTLDVSNLEIEKVLLQVEQIPNNFSKIILNQGISIDSLYSITSEIVKNNPIVYGSAIAFEPDYFEDRGHYFSPFSYRSGDSIISKQLGNAEYDYFGMDWYLIPKLLQKPYWSEPYYDEGGGSVIMTTYSVPMYNNDGNFVGIFTCDISLDWFSDLVNSIKPYPHAYTFVIGRGGTYIIHYDKKLILNESIFAIAIEKGQDVIRAVGQDMVDGHTSMQMAKINGEKSYIFYAPIPRISWSIGMVCPYDEVFAELNHNRNVLIWICITGLLLIFVFCYLIIRKLTKPLHSFAISANEIAAGNLDARLPYIKSEDEMKDLHDAFQNMQHDLKEYMANLQQATVAKEKIESELRIAHEIQMSMIPKIFPPFPNRNDVDLYAVLNPAKEVGGDLYDFFIDKNRLFFTIGDVSGKGVPASLFMAVTRSLFRSVAVQLNDPEKIAQSLNNTISENNESNMFVTMFIGILDLASGHLRYCNAGHDAPVLIQNHIPTELSVIPNLPIGVFHDFQFEGQDTDIPSDTTIFLYTDGLSEAENKDAELFGQERIMNCLHEIETDSSKKIIESIIDSVHTHVLDAPQSDDLTLLVINFKIIKMLNRTIIIDNNIEEINKLHVFIEEISQDINLPADLSMQMDLALEEIVSNVILYAYKDLKNKKIEITAEMHGQELIFTVIDAGEPFDPTAKEDPDISLSAEDRPIGGLGVYIVKQLMDEISYTRRDNHNILKMKKNIE
ncbi:MAG: SpoIIE family protein phosphatase [Bacteroidales bacterium]|nr:SpoIIE family protein phosphatase [Bacteroidales bacterium]MDD3151640.1 SpoIIE family protein phosphatase [Bacteroidales bacterium]MDD3914025.1 SpoIIE family protein phosphatase [Bacteroidales bacterium]MDD4633875.1 SpoIIE family protein phosphatase [Bacteroidales bacterium]